MSFLYMKQASNREEILPNFALSLPKFMQKLIFYIKYKLFLPTQKEDVLILPILENHAFKDFRKLLNILKKKNSKMICLSDYLYSLSELRSRIEDMSITILNGRLLFPFLTFNVLRYLTTKSQVELSSLEVSILTNNDSQLIHAIIMELAKSVKFLTIVTECPTPFQKIRESLYEDLGIVIRVSNNKRKSLAKSNIILNYDFSEMQLNEYHFSPSAIIVNFKEKINIISKAFNGINVHFFAIQSNDIFTQYFRNKNLYLTFSSPILLESLCYQNKSFDTVLPILAYYQIEICSLFGNNGILDEREFTRYIPKTK